VATPSFVDPGYGVRGLALMREGVSAPEALKRLLAADANRDGRRPGGRRGAPRAYPRPHAEAPALH
jgi:uncharacterized Ntn-hydrolase superfamily protein